MMYLYVKTHTLTGLKYLGQTKRSDPHGYPGSGKYWIRHLDKHGYHYTTEILLKTDSVEELKSAGLFYSRLWDIVNSPEWANLKEEKGDGGWDHINSNPWKYQDLAKKQERLGKIGKRNKGTVTVIEKFRVSKNDPRYLSGELVGHTKGKLAAYDANNQFYYIDKNDPRLFGELRSNNSGKIYITNGSQRKLVYKSDPIPNGWYVGDNREKYNLGKIWINDGQTAKMIHSADPIPVGWRKGRSLRI